MRRGYVRLWFSFLLCLMLAVPAGPAEESPDPAPNVRVLLQRLNLTDRADLSLLGDYQVSWGSDSRMLLPSGSEISVQVRKGSLILLSFGLILAFLLNFFSLTCKPMWWIFPAGKNKRTRKTRS